MVRSSGIGAGQLTVAARGDLEDLGAQQALGLDRRLGAVAEPDVVVDVERDQHPRPVELDARTPCPTSKPDTCTAAPVVSPPASAKYAEYVLVRVEERQLVVVAARRSDDARRSRRRRWRR